jgi:hypothetical protein
MFSKGGAPAGGSPVATRSQAPDDPGRPRPTRDAQDGTRLDVTRKTRLDAARDRVRLPEPPVRDSHATHPRTPQAGQLPTAKPRREPAPAPAPAIPFIPSPPGNLKAHPGNTYIDQRSTTASADEHARTRRVADQTDHSVPVPDLLPTPQTSGRTDSPESQNATPAEQQATPRRTRESTGKSRASDAGTREDFKLAAIETKLRDSSGDGRDFPVLDIGNFANSAPGGSAGSAVFMGKVVSGTGATYQVTLYSSGPTGAGDAPDVSVTIPTIDPSEQIDAGTWLSAIFLFADADGNDIYSCQPPIWMS